MKNITRLNLTFLFIIVSLNNSFSQEVKAVFQLSSSQIKVGEQVEASLKIEVDTAVDVTFPSINKFVSDQLEIVEISEIQSEIINSKKYLTKTLKITSFDSGNHVVPSFKFILEKDESLDTVVSNAAFLKVTFPMVDTTMAIMDVKPPIDTPFKNREIWSYLNYLLYGIIGIVIALIGYQYYTLNRSKPKPVLIEHIRIEPPETIAIRALENLKNSINWETELGVKDFHEDLSIILRTYIQQRFKIKALERTSNEILKDISNRSLEKTLYSSLNQILILSDFVKYAKYKSSKDENQKSLENALLFVNKTKDVQVREGSNV